MQISEALNKKHQLENVISAALDRFTLETSLSVFQIEHSALDLTDFDDEKTKLQYAVQITVQL